MQRLHRPVAHGGDAQRAFSTAGFGDVYPTQWPWLIALIAKDLDRLPFVVRSIPALAVNSRSLSTTVLRHSANCQCFRAGGPSEKSLQGAHFPPLACLCCFRNTCLEPRNDLVSAGPRNLVPALPRRGGDITIEPHCIHINLQLSGAGEGNRTLVPCLGSRSSAIELHPPCP